MFSFDLFTVFLSILNLYFTFFFNFSKTHLLRIGDICGPQFEKHS
jgi:hypothetical protein